MPEKHEARLAGELAQRLHCSFGPPLDGLGGGEDGAVLPVRKLGDSVEHTGDARHVRAGQHFQHGTLHLPVGVADDEDAVVAQAHQFSLPLLGGIEGCSWSSARSSSAVSTGSPTPGSSC